MLPVVLDPIEVRRNKTEPVARLCHGARWATAWSGMMHRVPREVSVQKVVSGKSAESVDTVTETKAVPAARGRPRGATSKRRVATSDNQARAANSTAERAIDILLL